MLDYMQRQIETMIRDRQFSTARNYRRAMNSLAGYLAGCDLPLRGGDRGVCRGV